MKIFFTGLFLILASCSSQRTTMHYDKFFQVELGMEEGRIGSNLPIIEAFTDRRGLPSSFLLDVSLPRIKGDKVYFADTYNKKVEVFHRDGEKLVTIASSNDQYAFSRPYLLYVDKMENIYVVASEKDNESFEVQHYSNRTMSDKEQREFNRSLSRISPFNYYVYKFSGRGDFLTRFGFTEGDPMPLPVKIDGDNLGNIYLQFSEESGEAAARLFLRRYSRNGEFNFEFDTRAIRIETNVGGISYQGNIASVNNLINDEQLLVLVEFQPLTNEQGETVPTDIDAVFSVMYVYSILENSFTRIIDSFKGITPGILGTDDKGRVFYENYDEESDTLRLVISPLDADGDEVHYVPLNSAYYTLYPYFIDTQGKIYNTVVDRNSSLFVLQWQER